MMLDLTRAAVCWKVNAVILYTYISNMLVNNDHYYTAIELHSSGKKKLLKFEF